MEKIEFQTKLILIIIIIIYIFLHYLTNSYSKVPDQSDEPYHLNQTLLYVNNYWKSYNKQLTTFPLTFILSCIYLKIKKHGIGINKKDITNKIYRKEYQIYLSDGRVCSIILSLITIFIFSLMSKNNNLLLITFFTFPIKFIYSFLIYTENTSILFMILYYYFEEYKKVNNKFLLFFIGLLSVLSRQLNIIWINFFPLMNCLEIIFYKKINFNILFDNVFDILKKYIHIALIDSLFIIFFFINKCSFVIGEKNEHIPKIHFAQIIHFLFYLLWHFPFLNFKLYEMFKNKDKKKKRQWIKNSIILFLLLNFFSHFTITRRNIFEHPKHYNRYYYLGIYYKRINRIIMLIYLSFLFGAFITDYFKFFKKVKIITWIICNLLSFCIEGLVEPRYFINGIYMLMILINDDNEKESKELSYYLYDNYINFIFQSLQDIYMVHNLVTKLFNAYVY